MSGFKTELGELRSALDVTFLTLVTTLQLKGWFEMARSGLGGEERRKINTCKHLQAIGVDLRELGLRMHGSISNAIPRRARSSGAKLEQLEIVNQAIAASLLSDGVVVFTEVDAEELERVSQLARTPVVPNATYPFDYPPKRQRRSRGVDFRKNGVARPSRSRLCRFLCVSAENQRRYT